MSARSKEVTFSSFHLRECQVSSCTPELIIAFSCVKGITVQIDLLSNGGCTDSQLTSGDK